MNTLVVLTGPTAVGKTELSLNLAKLLSSDIISADSRQIYKDMHIGTAAPTAEQLQQVKHYFVGILPLDQYYSAAKYETDVLSLLDGLFAKNDFALMTGGSMMYIDAVCNGIDEMPTVDDQTRCMLHDMLEENGAEYMAEQLKVVDPDYYKIVDLKNTKRIVHALEIFYMTGHPYSSFRTGKKKERPFRIVKIGLERERQSLFDRINRRVDEMMKQGFLGEAQQLYPYRHLNSLNTVGYKELFNVLDGTWDKHFAVDRIKKNTRVYAKKQLTWMRKDLDMTWINIDKVNMECTIKKITDLLGNV